MGDLTQKLSLHFDNSLHSPEHSSLHSIRGLDVAIKFGWTFSKFSSLSDFGIPENALHLFNSAGLPPMAHTTHHPLARTDNKDTINSEDLTLKLCYHPQLKYLNLMTY